MKYKTLIISFFVFLPIWWGVNVFSSNLEDFLFIKEITQNPKILNARIDYSISQLQLSKIIKQKNIKKELENAMIDADSIIVEDINEDRTIFEKDSFQMRPIASLTKLMTALVVYDLDETYNLSDIIKINKQAVEQEGDSILKKGQEIPIKDLLQIMLVESSNDAAFALTQPIGQKAFIDLMNYKTKQIGLNNTYFTNSTGLDPDDPLQARNISTADDLTKLTKYILDNYPEIFQTTIIKDNNTNKLLTEYPEIIGSKTGWTPLAEGCLLIVTKNPNGKQYISIVLGSKDRFEDMRQILNILR